MGCLSHLTVLLNEAVDYLVVDGSGGYVDATFGRGGHSREILKALSPSGQLLAMDKDPEAEKEAAKLAQNDKRFHFQRGSFADVRKYAGEIGWTGLSGVLLDLGVSSPQLDDASRGFSFMKDGPLDMRMDCEQGESAAEWLQWAEQEEIARVLWEYGEERFSRRIARAIVKFRQQEPIVTTKQLAKVVTEAHPRWEKGKHPATKTFQAVRIHVNSELDDLKTTLEHSFELLKTGGRLVVISFHSLEDRMTKRFMQDKVSGPQIPKWVPIADIGAAKARIIAKKVRAGKDEVARNVRARSAVMRVLEKL